MRRFVLGALLAAVLLCVPAAWMLFAWGRTRTPPAASAARLTAPPRIDPDYTSLVIPPNIAPLNFRILEEGRDYLVRISSEGGGRMEIRCPDGTCRIPAKRWCRLLQTNRGRRLFYDVFVQAEDGTWRQYGRFASTVAEEPIDSHVVYRLLMPNKCRTIIRGIYQRDLESFRESALVTTNTGSSMCFNCHSFHQHDPNRFLFHVRREHPGMMLVLDGKTRKVDTRQDPMFRPLAYTSWHPDGRHVAGTCNRFLGHLPENARLYYFEALEKRGDLAVYDVHKNTLSTTEAVFGHEYVETHPCWSPDGKYIYYARCKDVPTITTEDWEKNDFDLMRISYDVASDAWGSPETVKAYSEQGLSCSFPRPSPCGKYVLHVLADKTTYPIHQESSDLYLLDLDTKEPRRLDAVNSDLAESYPRWSSNGRWFSFVSNRRDAMSALVYLAYFDAQGEAHKAFVIPQKDPAFYDTFIDTYNVVELVKSRVSVSAFKLAQGIREPASKAGFPNPPEVDAYTGPTRLRQADY